MLYKSLKVLGQECKKDGIGLWLWLGLESLNTCLKLCTCLGRGLGGKWVCINEIG